ncbi:MAG TPA: hypothetical protein VGE93_17545, partial [Bryobacteraceae bacterium]
MAPCSKLLPGFLFTALLFVFAGCSPKAGTPVAANSFPPLREDADVLVVGPNQSPPEGCQRIGRIRTGGLGVNSVYDAVNGDARVQARKMGGNIVKIITYRDEGSQTPCYEIKADVLHSANADQLVAADRARKDSLYRSRFGDHPQYAILYVYRPGGAGALIGYNLHLGDSVICRMTNN